MLKKIWDKALNRDIRHITYHGDPVHEPLYKTFWRSANFKAAVISTLPLAVTNFITSNSPDALLVFSLGTASYCFLEGFLRWRHSIKYKSLLPEDGCIDKNGKLAVLKQENLADKPKMAGQALRHAFYGAASSLMISLEAFKMISVNSTLTHMDYIFPAMMLTNVVAREISAAYRFYKVAKGDWAIVKIPPAEQKQEQEHTLSNAEYNPA